MTARPDLDRRISGWLEEEADARAGDRFLEATRHRISRTRQRRVFALGGFGRDETMTFTPRVVAAAAALVAVTALATALLMRGAPSDVGVIPSASPTAVPPSASPLGSAAAGDGLLAAGTYTTTGFEPAITYTVPAGWRLVSDLPTLGLVLEASVTAGGIGACANPVASVADDNVADPEVGSSPQELAEWLAQRTDLEVVAQPSEFELDGLPGWTVDVRGLGDAAPGRDVVLFASTTVPSTCARNLSPAERLRFGFVELADSSTLMLAVGAFGSDALIEAGTEIVLGMKVEQR
jgi:hypothetical protein